MKKPYKVLALTLFSPLLLTGCSDKKQTAVNNIENNVLTVLKNDESVKQNFSNIDNLTYNFTGYEVLNNENKTLNVFGKLFDPAQKSYMKLSYDNVDFSKYDFDDQVNSFNSIAGIVSSNSKYLLQNTYVYDYSKFDNVFSNSLSQKDSNGHKLNGFEVLSVDNLGYNFDTNQMEFNSNVMADYMWRTTTIVLAGPGSPVPITSTHHNYENHSFDVKFNMLEEDYNAYKDDSKSLLNLLENYVESGLSNEYTITETNQKINTKNAIKNSASVEESGFSN